MKRITRGLIVLGGAAALAIAASRPWNADGVPLALASATASVSVAVAASARPPKRLPEAEPLRGEAFPSEPSARPTVEEWKTATPVAVARRSPSSKSCRVSRVREWMKVHCDGLIALVKQLAGETDEVLVWVEPHTLNDFTERKQGGEVIFPLRRGDRRIFQFFSLGGGGYEGFASQGEVVVDARWRSDGPRLILR